MSLDEPVVKSAYRRRGAAQKQRRLELKVIRADERYRARYQALKAEMAAWGHAIGTIRDLDEMFANDPVRRHEVLKARVDRWDALWSITKRKRETSAKIVLGGAVLAELAKTSPSHDSAFADWITDLLDRRVLRVRDRVIVRDLTGLPLSLRPGGPLDETVEQALKAIGDQSVDLDRGTLGIAGYREGDEEETFDLR
jgi:hypothetical protein